MNRKQRRAASKLRRPAGAAARTRGAADSEEVFRSGVEFHLAGRLDEARAVYEEIVAAAPHHAEALRLLGVIAQQVGDHQGSIEILQRALLADPESVRAHNNLGHALRALDRADEAIGCYRRALAIDPEHPETHDGLASAHMSQGAIDEAIACYQRALALKPNHAESHSNLGFALWKQGKPDAAAARFARALAIDPNLLEAHVNLGNLALERDEAKEAAASFERALELLPDHPEALDGLGRSLIDQGETDRAIGHYERFAGERPELPKARLGLSIALSRARRFGEAEAAAREAVRIAPDSAEACFELAGRLYEAGRKSEAAPLFEETLRLDPSHRGAHEGLSLALYVMHATGHREQAIAIARRWLERFPENPFARHLVPTLSGEAPPARASDDYVREIFDSFASTFDKTLTDIGYHMPEWLEEVLGATLGAPANALDVLDAGCGTGLCAPPLRRYARRLEGVDLSTVMLEKARGRGLYDALHAAEIVAFLQARRAAYDLIVLTDVLNYFGDLEPLLTTATAATRPGGAIALSVERGTPGEAGYRLAAHGRYSHTEEYLLRLLSAAGLLPASVVGKVLRMELGEPVEGLLVVATKPALEVAPVA